MTKRICWLASAAGIVILAVMFTNGYAQNSLPGQRGFNWLPRTHTTRKLAKVPAQTMGPSSPARDTQALTLANQALKALTGGLAITDATVQGSSNFIAGSDQESGSATLEARAGYASRIVLTLSGGQRSEVRNGSGAPPQAKWSGPD